MSEEVAVIMSSEPYFRKGIRSLQCQGMKLRARRLHPLVVHYLSGEKFCHARLSVIPTQMLIGGALILILQR